VKGSSLPNRSGMPNCWNLAARAFDRWQASWIICSVDVVATFAEVEVDVEVEVEVEVDVDVEVDVVKQPSHAEADRPATAKTAAATLPDTINLRDMCICFMVLS
jgi:hypothetical protein